MVQSRRSHDKIRQFNQKQELRRLRSQVQNQQAIIEQQQIQIQHMTNQQQLQSEEKNQWHLDEPASTTHIESINRQFYIARVLANNAISIRILGLSLSQLDALNQITAVSFSKITQEGIENPGQIPDRNQLLLLLIWLRQHPTLVFL